jgi:hypothetical protein
MYTLLPAVTPETYEHSCRVEALSAGDGLSTLRCCIDTAPVLLHTAQLPAAVTVTNRPRQCSWRWAAVHQRILHANACLAAYFPAATNQDPRHIALCFSQLACKCLLT